MDPNEALRQLRDRMAKIQKLIDERSHEFEPPARQDLLMKLEDEASEAVDFWNGLDHWMSMAGALPDAWAKGR